MISHLSSIISENNYDGGLMRFVDDFEDHKGGLYCVTFGIS